MPDDHLIAVHAEKINSLEESREAFWKAFDREKEQVQSSFEKVRDKLAAISAQLAAFGVVNTLIMAWIAYKLTKGHP